MVKSLQPASGIVIIHTAPGSASLVARHLDLHRPAGALGTIAGDDTVFLALGTKQVDRNTIREIQESLAVLG
jgi:transcriptional regulator of arginine metabolism